MRKILVVVDMQNDFIDGVLGSAEAVSILERVKEKIRTYPAENIYATRDTHNENYLSSVEGAHLPVPHCIKGTRGWNIRKELMELMPDAHLFDKPTFGSLKLAEALRGLAGQEELEIELIGLCTDICVVSNALLLKAYLPECRIAVDSACCAGTTAQRHEAALDTMRSCHIEVR